MLDPCLLLSVLYLSIVVNGQFFSGSYLLLMILVFLVSTFVYNQMEISSSPGRWKIRQYGKDIVVAWLVTVAILALIGKATGLSEEYPRDVLILWVLLAPIALFCARTFIVLVIGKNKSATDTRSAIIIASNDAGSQLYSRIAEHPITGIDVVGFFDDRDKNRQSPDAAPHCIGTVNEVADYAKTHRINLIFICMPMVAQPRVVSLLEELKDTTASIYFVPDIENFGFMQARVDDFDGMPLVGICESPFAGFNGVVKRCSDIVLAGVIQLLLLPIMFAIAIGVKLSSPGPVIFAQRRYGLDGEEIIVYKFRSMTVCEDGAHVAQATKFDARVTKFGAFLRKTSLDELPQFFNVLQGRMSIVGPRPHAVAHNELYRGLIKGYMLRHKVKPGITGWAQVNGLRGETDTVEKMRARVEFDLDYLRHWSLLWDLQIIAQTFVEVLKRRNAY
jgi:putative colanic acid biosynthesis UDP-glucose lipid carrier transferase